jgi:hypothetical protein
MGNAVDLSESLATGSRLDMFTRKGSRRGRHQVSESGKPGGTEESNWAEAERRLSERLA